MHKLTLREKVLVGALAALVIFAPAFNLLASTPPSQLQMAPGQPVIVTGATPAAAGATAGAGLVVDTVNNITSGLLLDVRNNGVSKFNVDYAGVATTIANSTGSSVAFTLARTAVGVGWTVPFTFTSPADTALTAGTEFNDWVYTGAIKTWSTGALTTERAMLFGSNTLGFVAGSTLTNAVTMDIQGPPVAGTNATITNSTALRIETAAVGGTGAVTNAFGFQVAAPTGGGTANVAASFNGPVGMALSNNFVPTSLIFSISDVANTTSSTADISHTTTAIASGGTLLKLNSTSVDTGTTTGNLLDLSASASVAGTLAKIAASNASQTTETALAVTQTGTGAGYTGNFVSFTASSTTGTGNLLSLTCVNTSAGGCESITSNALTQGTAFIIPHTTSVIASSGSLMRLSSTSADTGTTTGNLLDLSSTASTAGSLMNIAASSGSQTTTAALTVTQSATGAGYTGAFVAFVGSSTTGTGSLFKLTCINTTAGSCQTITDNAVTTGTAFIIPHTTSVIASGGSLMRLSSTSVDTGSTTGNLLDLASTGSTTGSLMNIAASGASQTSGSALTAVQTVTTTGYTGDFVSLTGSFSGAGGGDLLGLTCVNTTAGSCQKITSNSLTTGTALVIPHTTSVLSGAGSLLRVSSTSVDTSTTNGSLLDLSSTAAVASNLVNIAASAAAQTTGTALNVVQTVTTTGFTGNFVSFTGSFSGAGGGNLFSLTCVNTTVGSCESITSNALTTGTALIIPHTTTLIANGGSLFRLSSTSADTGTTTGNLLDLSATASVAGNLVNIVASNGSQTTETALSVTQTTTTTGFTGSFVNFTGSFSGAGGGSLFALNSVHTTAGNAFLINANSLTTTTAVAEKISVTAMTTGTAFLVVGAAANVTNAGSYVRVNDGTSDLFRVGTNGHLTFVQATAPTEAAGTCTAKSVIAGGTDTRGTFQATCNNQTFILTFNKAFAVAPICVITASNTAAAAGAREAWTTAAGAVTVTVPGNITTGQWNYICME